MKSWRARTWVWFGLVATLLVSVMVWLTVTLASLDRDEAKARAQAVHQERLRLALWRMDSWLSAQLAREVVRPPGDYRPFAPAEAAWTQGFSRLGGDQVLVTSNLLGRRQPLFELHFEIDSSGAITSPQVPLGNQRDVCEANGVAGTMLDEAAARLEALRPQLGAAQFAKDLAGAEQKLPTFACNAVVPPTQSQLEQSAFEYNNRAQVARANVVQAPTPNPSLLQPAPEIGPLVPFWLDGDDGKAVLVFARRVRDGADRMQGFVVDWRVLHEQLLGQLDGLAVREGASLMRCDAPTAADQATMLASVPVRLCVPPPTMPAASGLPMFAILTSTWTLTAMALGALAFTLRAAIGYGERRARFASAVTHELRTPLTTFRMYSEMLAEGMVTDPAAQKEYLGTLQRESDRLARVVENVLAWSRLEDGRFTSRRAEHRVGELLDGVLPLLQRRLAEVSLELVVEGLDAQRDIVVSTDGDAVGQILFNLVDNAAKYAVDAAVRTVEVQVAALGDAVTLAVRDHGPGVAEAFRERVFAPFDRGAVLSGDNDTPGVGLGLPLARGLARDLGGDLRLDGDVRDGARFVLRLPRA